MDIITKDFHAIIKGLTNEKTAAIWKNVTLIKLNVYPQKAMWRLIIRTPSLVTADDIDDLARCLENNIEILNKVDIEIDVQGHERRIEDIIMSKSTELLAAWSGNQSLEKSITWLVQNGVIDFTTDKEETYRTIIAAQICNSWTEWFWNNYRLKVLVRIKLLNPAIKKEQRVLKSAYEPLEFLENVPPSTRKNKAYKKGKGLYEVSLEDSQCTPFEMIEESSKTIIVEGEIWDKKIHQLRDGNYILTLYITDGRDSVMVKNMCANPDLVALSIGDSARFKGYARYDQGAREIVVQADSYMRCESKHRQDLAPRKRVELHAHTKMSAMDGLTDLHDLIKQAADWQHAGIAITDHGCIQAFPEAYKFGKKYNIKIIYGIEAYLVNNDKREKPYHIILLVKNQTGLHNLYQLISLSYIDNFYRRPKILRSDLENYREGLILGSACESGELYTAVLENRNIEEINEIARFYDYLEIQPIANNDFLVRNGIVKTEEQLIGIVRKIVDLGKLLDKPVVATGDVHFLEPQHELFRRIIQSAQGYDDAEGQAPLYFRSTEEMLNEFQFLEPEIRENVVISSPNIICDMIENVKPVPDGFYPPKIDGAAEELIRIAEKKANDIYGNIIPAQVEERMNRELEAITKHGFSVLYIVAHKLVKKSNEDGYIVGSRGSVGSSLVAYLSDITEVNPLPPHYLCPQCGYCDFVFKSDIQCGVDLPESECPSCKTWLKRDGFDIPFETFLGFEADKVPDIDLNFSGEYQSRAHQYVEEIFGSENVFRAGTVSTIADKKAYGFIKKFEEEQNLSLKNSEINRLVKGISGVRKTTGQHPGGLIVIPHGHSINEFTPIQHPADNKDSGIITTHFEYHALGDQLVKLDILGHDDPTVLRLLEDLTGIKATAISLSDKKTMAIFSSLEPLGIKSEDINSKVGTLGIPEFGTRFVRQMLETTLPTTFSELIRISGLSHGTDVWVNNAQNLINKQTATLNEVICTRDDIMTYLIHEGVEKKQAFKIMEQVRKGNGLKEEDVVVLGNYEIPSWYIESCQKIKYMFPKAHAVAYVTMAFRIAFFKVYYPLEFYASFFSIRAEDFEAKTIIQGFDAIKRRIKDIEKAGLDASPKDKKLLPVLEVALEMYARGFQFYQVDIYESQANTFILKDGGLLLPFSALPNVGANAAQGIVAGRGEHEFVSIEDFQLKTKLNKTSMEILRQNDCFQGMPESNQMSLFAMAEEQFN